MPRMSSMTQSRDRHVLVHVPANDDIEVLVGLKPETDRPRVVDCDGPPQHHLLDSFIALPADASRDVGTGDALQGIGHLAGGHGNTRNIDPAASSKRSGR